MIPATLTSIGGVRKTVELPGRHGPDYLIDGARLYARQPGPWIEREVYHEVHCAMTLDAAETLARLEAREAAAGAGAAGDMGTGNAGPGEEHAA